MSVCGWNWQEVDCHKSALIAAGCLQVSAMQIIDRLETNKRGPYGGGFGHVSFTGVAMRLTLVQSSACYQRALANVVPSPQDMASSVSLRSLGVQECEAAKAPEAT